MERSAKRPKRPTFETSLTEMAELTQADISDPNKTATIRFRVTNMELYAIQLAAERDFDEFAIELYNRGLDAGQIASFGSPGEWARMKVIGAARKKLEEMGIDWNVHSLAEVQKMRRKRKT